MKVPSYTYVILLLFNLSSLAYGQVGIGTTNPDASAILDIGDAYANKGILIPRINIENLSTKDPITATDAAESLLVYNTNSTTGKGFYYWDGKWILLRAGDAENIYTSDGTLTANRTVSQENKTLTFQSDTGRNAMTIKRTNNTTETGLAFKNSDNSYDAGIYMESGNDQGLVIAAGGNELNPVNLLPSAIFNKNQTSSFSNGIAVFENDANVNDTTSKLYSESNYGSLNLYHNNIYNHRLSAKDTTIFNDQQLDLDFRIASDNSPDTFFVDASSDRIGIRTAKPSGTFHVFEGIGTVASPNTGTIVLEHENAGGSSSVVFKSTQNSGSDFGYIEFSDDGSGNGNSAENALLEIGIINDGEGNYQDDLNLAPAGNVGIKTRSPKQDLHIGGSNSTIRVEGLSNANNANNVTADPSPVYVDNNGDFVLKPSLTQTFMPVNAIDFTPAITATSSSGDGIQTQMYQTTITLTQESLVNISYQFSVTISAANGGPIVDGASRLFRSGVIIDNSTTYLAYDTGTYTNNPGSNTGGTYASGYYYLNGSGYAQLNAGTHTLTLYARSFGGSFGYSMIFGETNQDRFQVVIQR
tara:strand:+ start:20656 stop:22410 length:1755 start_codon:yes stop_codon:yes gene_type:complete